jgi:hypothetical protein
MPLNSVYDNGGIIGQIMDIGSTDFYVSVSVNSEFAMLRSAVASYRVPDQTSLTVLDTDEYVFSGSATTQTLTTDVENGGLVIYDLSTGDENDTATWSGATETYDFPSSENNSHWTGAYLLPTSDTTGYVETITLSGATNNGSGVAVSYAAPESVGSNNKKNSGIWSLNAVYDNNNVGTLLTATFNTASTDSNGLVTWSVPAGVTSITAKMWGAAGGSSDNAGSHTSGAGGYATATIDVTGQSSLNIYVGHGGSGAGAGLASTPGGVGYGTGGAGQGGGAGGGGSAILFGTTAVLVAGGGGGRSASNWNGGAGGGTNGENGTGGSTDGIGGFGASGATGGAADLEDDADASAGSAAPGGDGGVGGGGSGTIGGAGGGGGYAGGGGGGGGTTGTEGGGGGGSGYQNPTYCTNATLTAGSGATPGNSSDTDRPTGVGEGTSTTSADGGDGYVFISYLA